MRLRSRPVLPANVSRENAPKRSCSNHDCPSWAEWLACDSAISEDAARSAHRAILMQNGIVP